MKKNKIECRPIVTGNFVKNKDVLKYFNYEIHGDKLLNADYIDSNGLFVGNHQIDISRELEHLFNTINEIK